MLVEEDKKDESADCRPPSVAALVSQSLWAAKSSVPEGLAMDCPAPSPPDTPDNTSKWGNRSDSLAVSRDRSSAKDSSCI